jgi:hypothetical protein
LPTCQAKRPLIVQYKDISKREFELKMQRTELDTDDRLRKSIKAWIKEAIVRNCIEKLRLYCITIVADILTLYLWTLIG